jgi:hypothetical protein
MKSLINQNLVKAIADMAIFLEFTSSELLDEDTSIGAMEQLAAELQLMNDEERGDLVQQLKKMSKEYSDEHKSNFIANLPETIGLE